MGTVGICFNQPSQKYSFSFYSILRKTLSQCQSMNLNKKKIITGQGGHQKSLAKDYHSIQRHSQQNQNKKKKSPKTAIFVLVFEKLFQYWYLIILILFRTLITFKQLVPIKFKKKSTGPVAAAFETLSVYVCLVSGR